MSTMSQRSGVPEHPFLSHLLALLSVYELESNIDPKPSAGTPAIPLPRYEGPRDFQTDAIERSLANLAHRMHVAEEKLGTVHLCTPNRGDTRPDDDKPDDSPLIVPPSPLRAVAFESSMSAVEELRLLKAQISDVVRVCNAVAMGDLGHKITVSAQGVVMEQFKDVVNTMVDNLRKFAKEVAQATRVDTDSYVSDNSNWIVYLCKCDYTRMFWGRPTVVEGIRGTWWDLTSDVKGLASQFRTTVRSTAIVTTAVARGDLSQLLDFDAKGESLEFKACPW